MDNVNPFLFLGVVAGMWLLVVLLAAWCLVWKGIALWKAARLKQKGWFVALLLINTLGILEIIYIFAVAKNKELTPERL